MGRDDEMWTALRRLANSADDLIRGCIDPGTEALGAVHEARRVLARDLSIDDLAQPVAVHLPELPKVEGPDGTPLDDEVQEQVRDILLAELTPVVRLLSEAGAFGGLREWRPGLAVKIDEAVARHAVA